MDDLNGCVLIVGYASIACFCVLGIAGVFALTGMAINKSLWFFVEALGGLPVFNEFRKYVLAKKGGGDHE
jgi:hypothetical protein